MHENKLKAKLDRGEPAFGVISAVSEPMIVEMIGIAGFEFFMVDGEHGPITPAQAAPMVRASEAVDITPLVRVGQKDIKLVLQYLDVGMMGIMMPGLETPAEIEMLVSAVKYPPLGKRGLGFARSADYLMGTTTVADHVASANAQTLVMPQFEDSALLDHLPAMARVPGVDGFVIGPADLSLNMGFPGDPGHPAVQTVINQAIVIIRDAGLFVGITAATGDGARAEVDRGVQLIMNWIPNLIERSSKAFLEAARINQA